MRLERENFRGDGRKIADMRTAENFLSAFGNFNAFFVYNSFGSETDTSRIISELLNKGKRVYLPRVEGDIIVPVPYGETEKGAFGIEEPKGRAYTGDIEVTVVPLLAVNARGFRIGYGKGFYDRFLKNRKTLKVGLCYSFQKAVFDGDGWDEPLDFIVTERGVEKVICGL